MNSNINVTGTLRGVICDSMGLVKHEWKVRNLVVTVGRQHIADQMSDQAQNSMGYMAIGTGTNSATSTDTALQTELDRNALTSKDPGTGGEAHKVIYICDWAAGDGTGAITEAGIFNSPSAGTMLCRTTFAVKNKGATDTMKLTWTITYTA